MKQLARHAIPWIVLAAAAIGLAGCGSAASLFDSIDRLVKHPPGGLDTSFGGTGIVTTPVGSSLDQAYGIAIQSDDKIVVAGFSNMANNDFAVVRYTTAGELDSTFGSGGAVTTSIGSSWDQAIGVKIQSDGKIVAAGFSDLGGNYDFAVARYESTGTPDSTFDGDGKLTTAIGSTTDQAYGVAIQSLDGKIVVVGISNNGTDDDFAVARYEDSGALDATFSTDGKVTTPIGSGYDQAFGVAIQSDGKIVVVGSSNNGTNYDFAVVRYTTTGALDSTGPTAFDTDGKLTTAIGSGNDQAYGVAIQGDGKIVVAGFSNNGTNYDFAVVRYLTDGSLDSTFGSGGKVTTPIGSELDQAYGVAIQGDGKIVVAGYSNNGSNNDFAVVRYTTTGALDSTFGSGGKVTTPIGSGLDQAYGVGIQSDGKIVVAGYSNNGSNDDFAVVRYVP